jgi:hypothetical protein
VTVHQHFDGILEEERKMKNLRHAAVVVAIIGIGLAGTAQA